ncbi:MAG: hypothetical protein AAF467_01270 [Actinomycetota bacterium]
MAAAVLLGALLAFTASPASASENDVALGGSTRDASDSAVSGMQIDLFDAVSSWERGAFVGPARTDGGGGYRFSVEARACYILVGVAPLGFSFDSPGSGRMYDQRYACTDGDANLAVDFTVYADTGAPDDAPKPPPTTDPPVTHPPTTSPPTTKPPSVCDHCYTPPIKHGGQHLRQGLVPGLGSVNYGYFFGYEVRVGDLPADWHATSIESMDVSDIDAFLEGVAEISGGWFEQTQLRDPNSGPSGGIQRDLDYVGSVFGSTGVTNAATNQERLNEALPRGYLEVPVEFITKSGKVEQRLLCVDVRLWAPYNSPIALDVDGSGDVERVAGEFAFDFDADGSTELVSEWFAPTEGILFDSRFAGPVTGEHLFGDQGGLYVDGFEKLALLDINGDGQVAGVELDGLAIWTDVNSNALVDSGEVSSLADHQVVALSTSHVGFVSEAVLADGSTMVTEDLWFTTAEAGASTSPVARVGVLGMVGVGLLAIALVTVSRRRDQLDAELASLADHTTA